MKCVAGDCSPAKKLRGVASGGREADRPPAHPRLQNTRVFSVRQPRSRGGAREALSELARAGMDGVKGALGPEFIRDGFGHEIVILAGC